MVSPYSTVTRAALQMRDADNDSVGSEMIAVKSDSTITDYLAGYSHQTPFGPLSYTNIVGSGNTKQLEQYCPTTGYYAVAARISDYRNGILVGYSTREWTIRCVPNALAAPPLPAPGSRFYTTACPGGSNQVGLHFKSQVPGDSIFIEVLPENSFNYTINTAPGINDATATVSWTNPSTLNPALTPYYVLNVHAWTNRCPVMADAWYKIFVKTGTCDLDSVWPGDVNNDQVVDIYDPLDLALKMGSTGPARTAATIQWQGQSCNAWAGSFFNGANIKHADCDGNGTVSLTDTTAISNNYSRVHLRSVDEAVNKGTALPELYFDHSLSTPAAGNTITVNVLLGNSSQSMPNIFGLAGNFKIENILPDHTGMNFSGSWMGNMSNTLQFTKNTGTNTIDWALARTDRRNVSGNGQIASVTIGIPATTPMGTRIVLKMTNVRIIDSAGAVITGYNNIYDTIDLVSVSVPGIERPGFSAVVAPNPSTATARLQLKLDKPAAMSIIITDITGRVIKKSQVWGNQGILNMQLPEGLASGVYVIRISDGYHSSTIKWVRTGH